MQASIRLLAGVQDDQRWSVVAQLIAQSIHGNRTFRWHANRQGHRAGCLCSSWVEARGATHMPAGNADSTSDAARAAMRVSPSRFSANDSGD